MKKHNRFFALLLAAMMLAAICPVSVSADGALNEMKIVAFGDSLTHYGATDSGNVDAYGNKIYTDAYPDFLAEKTGATVVNAGVGGNTTDQAWSRIWSEVINEQPDLVIICLGMNDQAFNQVPGSSLVSLAAYRANLERFVREIRKSTQSEILFLTPNPVCEAHFTYWEDPNYNYGLLDDFCNAMREVAIQYGCDFVDAYAEFNALDDMSAYMAANDGVHQNTAGREFLADCIADYLNAKYNGTDKATMTIRCEDEDGKVLAEFVLTGAKGADVIVPSPDLPAYTAITADKTTTFVDGAVHKFTYSSDILTSVEEAGKTLAKDYDSDIALALQMAYGDAMNLHFAATPDFEEMEKAVLLMNSLIAAKGNGEFVVSQGKSYTATEPNYYQWDAETNTNSQWLNLPYADDGIRLTDGIKSEPYGGCSSYSAWTSDAEITVDLGEFTEVDLFSGYFASDEWGVANPDSVSVSYLNSEGNWVNVAGSTSVTNIVDGYDDPEAETTDGVWSLDKVTFTADEPIIAQNVKIKFTKAGNFVWLDEVEIAKKVSPTTMELPGIDGVNTAITGGDTKIFTPGFEINSTSANLNYTANIKAVWDVDKNAYIITDKFSNNGTTKTETLGEGEILIAAHCDADGTGWENCDLLQNGVEVGQAVYLNGVDVANGIAICATFEIGEASFAPDDVHDNEGNIALGKEHTGTGFIIKDGMWPANYSADLTDGKAATSIDYRNHTQWFGISTKADDDGEANADENGVAEIIVDLGGMYDLDKIKVNTFVGLQDGIGAPASIKAYASDSMNGEYELLGELAFPESDSDVVWAELAIAEGKGQFIKIEVTIGKYDDGVPYFYAFINEIEVYGTESEAKTEQIGLRGDITKNGEIDSRDYVFLKRAYFGTYKLDETAKLLADVNNSGGIDSRDYVFLKRAYFGTYKIPENIKYVYAE